jgi:hypothetical protein
LKRSGAEDTALYSAIFFFDFDEFHGLLVVGLTFFVDVFDNFCGLVVVK